jgi:GDP-mannose 4,6-dehydratase
VSKPVTRVLVTGAAGMTGSHLTDQLLAETDWQIFGVVRPGTSTRNLADALATEASARLVLREAELEYAAAVSDLVASAAPDLVYHLAAQSSPGLSFSEPQATVQANLMATTNLLEAMRLSDQAKTLVMASSSEVYSDAKAKGAYVDEEADIAPASPYAATKIAAELMSRVYADAYGLDVRVMRTSTHTGPRRSAIFAESAFARQIAMIEADAQAPVLKVGDLSAMRTYTDVRDIARAYHMAAGLSERDWALPTVDDSLGDKWALFNVGGDTQVSISSVLETLVSLSTMASEIVVESGTQPRRPLEVRQIRPNSAKFMKATGWRPSYEIDQTLLDLLNYWRREIRAHHPQQ